MTRAEHILSLDDGKRSTREIADMVGCGVAYVRTVRQRKGTSRSEADRRYYVANRDKHVADATRWREENRDRYNFTQRCNYHRKKAN